VIDADAEIRRCIDERKSFLVDAGAGSGKTSSLVGALRHLIDTQLGATLAQKSQRIACITFTNIATDQIVERTARNPLLHVSTIHDFLWRVIKPHQKALKRALLRHNRELKGTSARKRNEGELEVALRGVSVTYSDRGAEFLEGRLFHDDLVEVAARVFEDNALMAQIVGARYPFIFVDEYQDTSRLVIGILDRVMTAARGKAVVGYFGDKLQHIYDGGVGEIQADRQSNLVHIPKSENYRCSKAVIALLNRIRTDIRQFPAGKNVDGSAVYIRLSRRGADDDVLTLARAVVQTKLNWDLTGEQKELFLTHRLIARKAGYDTLLEVYNQRGSFSRDALLKGEDPIIRFFQASVEPLLATWRAGKTGKVLSLLRAAGFTLKDNPAKARVKEALDRLVTMASNATVREVLRHLDSAELLVLLDDLKKGLGTPETDDATATEVIDERQAAEWTFYRSLLALPYAEVSSFCTFLEEHTPFSTHHGVKGDEFATVFVVLDDGGARWNLYSFDKYLSGEDEAKGMERFRRTRNLFYVCCSRAQQNLAVVDLGGGSPVKDARIKALFGTENCFF
jgi:DNA helicase-2/ATP-dependent DNA helicase PcrA